MSFVVLLNKHINYYYYGKCKHVLIEVNNQSGKPLDDDDDDC